MLLVGRWEYLFLGWNESDDECLVLEIGDWALLPCPEGVVDREGINRHCQVLRVHLTKTLPTRIVSERKRN
jgi:hypothetical protein